MDYARSSLVLIWLLALAHLCLCAEAARADQLALSGKFAVGANGDADYTMQIAVPPGSGGLAPSLGLSYSSQSGDGYVGLGWTLTGLPSITRCAPTLAQDGVVGTITYTMADKFCLDGQRLMAISGAYGADGTEYRTERESYNRVISHGVTGNGPTWFEVHTKDGLEMDFGYAPDPVSAPSYNSHVVVQGGTTIRVWNLGESKDYATNYYKVTYLQDGPNGTAYPSRIDYTGNAGIGQGTYDSVRFVYDNGGSPTRPDQIPFYRAGKIVEIQKLLTNIQTFQGSGLVSNYTLAYGQSSSTQRSELASVTLVDANGNQMPPTNFHWDGSSAPLGGAPVAEPFQFPDSVTAQFQPTCFVTGNFSGTGRPDVLILPGYNLSNASPGLYFAQQNGSYQKTSFQFPSGWTPGCAVVAGDWNGSGRTGIAVQMPADSSGNPGSEIFYNVDVSGLTQIWNHNFANDLHANYSIIPGGFDGSGKAGFIVEPGSTVDCTGGCPALPTAGLWLPSGSTVSCGSFFCQVAGFAPNWLGIPIQLGDFDGDGRTDIAVASSNVSVGAIYLAKDFLTGSTTSSTQPAWTYPGGIQARDAVLGDWNGDGKTDIGSQRTGTFYLSTGTGFAASGYTVPNWPSGGVGLLIADFNGDGMSDFLGAVASDGSLTVYSAVAPGGSGIAFQRTVLTQPPGLPTIVGDIAGKGAPDIVYFTGLGTPSTLQPTTFVPDEITKFSTGLNATTTVTYSPLDRTAVYTEGTSASYPTVDTENALFVVSNVQAPNYSGAAFSSTPIVSTYTYAGAQIDQHGRGFLGFAAITSSRQASDLVNATDTSSPDTIQDTTNYWTGWPLTGMVASMTRTLNNSILLNQTTYTYCEYIYCTDGPSNYPGVWRTDLRQTYVQPFELNGVASTTTTTCYGEYANNTCTADYNIYGAPFAVTAFTSDGYKSIATNTYSNTVTGATDTNPYLWVINKPTKSVVVASAPNGVADVTRTTTYSYCLPSNTNCASPFGYLYRQVNEPPSGSPDYLVTTYGYDNFGNKNAVTISGTGVASRTTSTTYDVWGRYAVSVTDALGMVDTYVNDPLFGGITKHTDPNGNVITWTYDGFGRKVQEDVLDPSQTPGLNSIETAWTYNAPTTPGSCGLSCYIRQTTVRMTAGAVDFTVKPAMTTYYDALERPRYTATTSFNSAGNVISNMTTYDVEGNKATVTLPYTNGVDTPQVVTYLYDAVARELSQSRPDGSVLAHAYGVFYLPFRIDTLTGTGLPAAGEATITAVNGLGKINSVRNALLQTQTYTYDGFGEMLSATDPAGNVASMTYSPRGHLTLMDDPDLGTHQYSPDALGEVLSETDQNGQQILYSYDLLGRMTTRNEIDVNNQQQRLGQWFYDQSSTQTSACTATNSCRLLRQTTSTDQSYSRTEAYDAFSRPSATTIKMNGGPNWVTTTTYDAASRALTITDPSGFVRAYHYSGRGYLDTVCSTAATCTAGSANIIWNITSEDAMLHVTGQSFGNGIATSETFDPATYRLTNISTGPSATPTSVQNIAYTWDAAGNLKRRNDQRNTVNEGFTYDALNRLLTSAVAGGATKTIVYDPNGSGNITSKSDLGTYSYPAAGGNRPHGVTKITLSTGQTLNNGAQQITGSSTYHYDNNGNMYQGGGRVIHYTVFNVPDCITTGTGVCTSIATGVTTFAFDADHQRTQQVETQGSTTYTTTYINGGGVRTELYTTTNAGAVTAQSWRSYLVGDGEAIGLYTTPVVGTSTNTGLIYNHTDHLGSISALTNGTGGVLEEDAYDPWGKRRNVSTGADDPGDAINSRMTRGFTDQEHLEDFGLIHMNGRVYDPQIGRFTSADPIVGHLYSTQGWNRFAYTENNPLNATDPSGFDDCPYGPGNCIDVYPTPKGGDDGGASVSVYSGTIVTGAGTLVFQNAPAALIQQLTGVTKQTLDESSDKKKSIILFRTAAPSSPTGAPAEEQTIGQWRASLIAEGIDPDNLNPSPEEFANAMKGMFDPEFSKRLRAMYNRDVVESRGKESGAESGIVDDYLNPDGTQQAVETDSRPNGPCANKAANACTGPLPDPRQARKLLVEGHPHPIYSRDSPRGSTYPSLSDLKRARRYGFVGVLFSNIGKGTDEVEVIVYKPNPLPPSQISTPTH